MKTKKKTTFVMTHAVALWIAMCKYSLHITHSLINLHGYAKNTGYGLANLCHCLWNFISAAIDLVAFKQITAKRLQSPIDCIVPSIFSDFMDDRPGMVVLSFCLLSFLHDLDAIACISIQLFLRMHDLTGFLHSLFHPFVDDTSLTTTSFFFCCFLFRFF